MFNQAIKRKQIFGAARVVAVAVFTAGVAAVNHGELAARIAKRLFAARAGFHIESPAMGAGFQHVHIKGFKPLHVAGGAGDAAGGGVVLEKSFEHYFVAVFISIGPMQHKGGVGLEPLNVLCCTVAWHNSKSAGFIAMKAVREVALGQRLHVPVQRQVIEDRVILCESHVVGQARTCDRDINVVAECAISRYQAVVHERRIEPVVKEQQLAGVLIKLGVGRNAFFGKLPLPLGFA